MVVFTPIFLRVAILSATVLNVFSLAFWTCTLRRAPAVAAVPSILACLTGLMLRVFVRLAMYLASLCLLAVTTDFFLDTSSRSVSWK